jgi:hypothetical protein
MGLRVPRIQSLLVRSVKQVLTTRPVVAPRTRLWAAGIAAVLAIAGVVALTVLNSGGGDSQPVADISSAPPPVTPPSSPAAPVAAPKPKAKPKPKLAINPLTGLKPSRNKVVAVKIDDTAGARPQVGLDRADIVYVEQVEGGLTRLVAIFNSHLPLRVGPVRSTRNDDPQIVRQYGPIIYVCSGGDHIEYRPMNRSDLHAVVNDRGGPGFSRGPGRPVPLNLFANVSGIAKKVNGPTAKSVGLQWSTKIINPHRRGTVVRTHVGGTPVMFRWSDRTHRYLRYFNGHVDRLGNGRATSTPNVIVQFVHGHVFPADIDPAGNPAWYQHTTGKGHVVVFRSGFRIAGRWSRPHAAAGTRLVDMHGNPIRLAPGGTWFLLVNDGTTLAH